MPFANSIKTIAILGEMGSGNLGDCLGYMVLKKEIEKHFEYIQIDWITPSRFSMLDYMGYDCVVTGCGTLLDRAGGEYMRKLRALQDRGTKTAILGSGVSDQSHIRDTKEGSQIYNEVMDKVIHKFIRGEKPDLMWLLGNKGGGNKTNTIGINMGFAGYTTISIIEIQNKVKQVEDYLKSQGYDVKRVSCWGNDDAWFPNPDIRVDGSEESLNKLSELKGIVAFRGHLGVVSACCNVNVCAIGYSQKIKQMYDGVNIDYKLLDINDNYWATDIKNQLEKDTNYQNEIKIAQNALQGEIATFCQKLRSN